MTNFAKTASINFSATFPIVGAYYRPPARALIDALPVGAALLLRPESTNEYDPHAVAVYLPTENLNDASIAALRESLPSHGIEVDQILESSEWQLGYIPRDTAGLEITRADHDLPCTFFLTLDGKPAVKLGA